MSRLAPCHTAARDLQHSKRKAVTASLVGRQYGATATSLSITGPPSQENNYRIDGVSINDYTRRAGQRPAAFNLGADAIQEFSVLASNYTSDTAETSAASSKRRSPGRERMRFMDRRTSYSATTLRYDQLHRQGELTCRSRRSAATSSAAPPAAPRPNKTFIFGDYEGIRRTQGVTSVAKRASPRATRTALDRRGVRPIRQSSRTSTSGRCRWTAEWPVAHGGVRDGAEQELTETGTVRRRPSFFRTGCPVRHYMLDKASSASRPADTRPSRTSRRGKCGDRAAHTSVRNSSTAFAPASTGPRHRSTLRPGAQSDPPPDSRWECPGPPGANHPGSRLTGTVGLGGNSFFDPRTELVPDLRRRVRHASQPLDQVRIRLRTGASRTKPAWAAERSLQFGSLASFLTNRPTNFFALDPTRSQQASIRTKRRVAYVNDSWRRRKVQWTSAFAMK